MGWISMIQPVLWESRISNISGRLLTSILVSRYAPGRVGRHTIQHIYAIIFIIFNLRHRVFLFFVFDYPIKHPLCAPLTLALMHATGHTHRRTLSRGTLSSFSCLRRCLSPSLYPPFRCSPEKCLFFVIFCVFERFCRFLCEFVIFPKLFENFQYLRKEPAMR